MYSNKPIVYKDDRRKKPDIICLYLEIATVFVWVILFCAIIFFQRAQPQVETFLDRYFEIQIRDTWDLSQMNIVFYILLFLLFFSAISLFLNSKRLKRNTDKVRISFIISLVGSITGIILYLIAF